MKAKRVAVAIFVKTPGLSPLKTRLAAELGKSGAEEFHRQATRCLEETLARASVEWESTAGSLTPFWAVAEEAAKDHPLWSTFQTIAQPVGSLGARMHSVYTQLLESYEAVLLLGADSPQISTATLTRAIELLADHEFVLGPASDGGFYLLGGTEPIPLSLWERVPYSVTQTAQRMREELLALGQITQTETLIDVDLRQDLPLVLPALHTFPVGSSQQNLAEWIENHLDTGR